MKPPAAPRPRRPGNTDDGRESPRPAVARPVSPRPKARPQPADRGVPIKGRTVQSGAQSPRRRVSSAQHGPAPTTGVRPVSTGRVAAEGSTAREAPASSGEQALIPVTTLGRSVGATKVPVLSTGMAARLAEQKAMRRHRLVRKIAIWAVSVSFALVGAWVVFGSSLLALDVGQVTVSGIGTSVDAAAVKSAVAAHEGTPLARLNTSDLRDELLEIANVKEVQITRLWPAGLSVEVVAREPLAAVPVDGGFALLDSEAVVVSTVEQAPAELPLITIPLTGDDRRTLAAALGVLGSLTPELTAEVASITAATQDAVTLTLRDGAVVEWGGAQDSELKVRVLMTLRSAEESKGARVFDVSAPTYPITR